MDKKDIQHLVIGLFIFILLVTMVNAQDYVFKTGQFTDLKVACFDENKSLCLSSTTCQMTINYPNMTNFVKNGSMTFNDVYFNYSLTQPLTVGLYSVVVDCQGTTDGYSTFTYLLTRTGEESTTSNTIFYLASISILILFLGVSIYGFVISKSALGKYVFVVLTYLFFTVMTYVSWIMADSFITNSSFLVWFLKFLFMFSLWSFLPFFFISMLFFLYQFYQIKAIKNLVERGIPEDEACKRVKKK